MTDDKNLEGRVRKPGEVWEEVDKFSGVPVTKRIDPYTRRVQERVQGGIGDYWGDSEYIIRDRYGHVIDLDLG